MIPRAAHLAVPAFAVALASCATPPPEHAPVASGPQEANGIPDEAPSSSWRPPRPPEEYRRSAEGIAGPPAAGREPDPPDPRAYRPSWWQEAAVVREGRLTLAAMADAPTLNESRWNAVEAGTTAMGGWLGREPAGVRVLRSQATELPGMYRTFVLMSCEAPDGR